MTISKALKKLYTAMCGGTAKKNTAGDLINEIADNYSGKGGDEAKDPLIVHGTADPITNYTAEITDDISLSEIYDAVTNARFVAFECSLADGNITRIPLAGATFSDNEYELAFRVATTDLFSSTKPAVFKIDFENSKTGTANVITTE